MSLSREALSRGARAAALSGATGVDRADAGDADRSRALGLGLDLRAEARRRARAGIRPGGVGAALFAEPPAGGRRLPGDGGGALARGAGGRGAGRRDRRAGSRDRALQLRAAAAADASARLGTSLPHRRLGRAVSVRLPVLRGHRSHRHAAAGPEEGAARRGLVRRQDPLHPLPHERVGRDVPRGLRQGRGGHHREAGRVHLRKRALHRLAQDQVRASAGIRHRRLHRAPGRPRAPRRAPGRLLRRRRPLRFAGKVGTGYDQDTLEMLHRRLTPLHRRTSPFAPGPVPAGEVQWVTPKLVAQIGFGEWTEAGLLRHPRYLGLRDDKAAREVRREEPKAGGGAARRRGRR